MFSSTSFKVFLALFRLSSLFRFFRWCFLFVFQVWESSRSRAATSPAVLFEWQPGDSDDTFLQAEQLARDTGLAVGIFHDIS